MGKKILVIDDNEQDQKVAHRHLSQAGYKDIVFAATGEDGVATAQKERPSLIVLDTDLPGIDGFETCKRIKAIEGLDTKIIVLTGLIDAVDAGKARENGADDYCVKTSDCASLLDAVQGLMV